MSNKVQVKEISKTFFETLGETVKIQSRPGRKILICSCINHEKFCIENPFCIHKEKVIDYILKKPARKRLDQMILDYKLLSKMDKEISINAFLLELQNLRRLL